MSILRGPEDPASPYTSSSDLVSGDTPRTDERELVEQACVLWFGNVWRRFPTREMTALSRVLDDYDSLRAEIEQTKKERDAAVERARTWADTAGAWNRTSNKASEAEHVKELQLAEALAQLGQTRENLTKCRKRAAELGSRLETAHHEVLERLRERDTLRTEVERLRAIEEAAKVIDALAQQRSCSLYEVAHESWPGQFGQLHRALTTQEDRPGVEGGSDQRWSGGDW